MEKLRKHKVENTLFPLSTRFRFVEVGAQDAQRSTDDVRVLKELIVANQDMYPDIDRWFAKKVLPGLRSSERVAYVAYENDRPIASAILKIGNRSKFCHVRVHEDFQDMDLGQMFFSQMTLEVRHHAADIYFTLPESLWTKRSKFFESFGFSCAVKASKQYRYGNQELVCSAPISTVWSAVLSKLPSLLRKFSWEGTPPNSHLLLSFKPKFADRILEGSKTVEIRKKFLQKWKGCRAVLYSSRPTKAMVGEARIDSITDSSPTEIWSRFQSHLGCSYEEFHTYVGSASQVSAIELTDVVSYKTPVNLSEVSSLLNQDLKPPQSFCDLTQSNERAWTKAASFATFLHAGFNQRRKKNLDKHIFQDR